jgi:hypothetical protein
VSPAPSCTEDTHNTLKYAHRAKAIKVQATSKTVSVEYHVSRYQSIIATLQGEVAHWKAKALGGLGGGLPRSPAAVAGAGSADGVPPPPPPPPASSASSSACSRRASSASPEVSSTRGLRCERGRSCGVPAGNTTPWTTPAAAGACTDGEAAAAGVISVSADMVSRTFPDFASSTKLMICATVNTRAHAHQEEGRRQPWRRALESKRERESESKAAS